MKLTNVSIWIGVVEDTATLLPNGEVLDCGRPGGELPASAELYNPATCTFTFTGMQTIRELFTATLLDTGEVLVAGGQNSNLVSPFSNRC
jgi:hypothetical protein